MTKERLVELMELLKMTPTQFAASIGVQRATLQHILSGRNEPSLKIVTSIHNRFPDIGLEWLLDGKGSPIPGMTDRENQPADEDYPFFPGFENQQIKPDVQKSFEFSNLTGMSTPPKQRKRTNNKEVNSQDTDTVKCKEKVIKEVVVFFEDGTYQKFTSNLKN